VVLSWRAQRQFYLLPLKLV